MCAAGALGIKCHPLIKYVSGLWIREAEAHHFNKTQKYIGPSMDSLKYLSVVVRQAGKSTFIRSLSPCSIGYLRQTKRLTCSLKAYQSKYSLYSDQR